MNIYMAEKGLNCGINKTLIMATKITVPDIGDFEKVEIIEILTKPGAIIKKMIQLLLSKVTSLVLKFHLLFQVRFLR